MFNLRSVLLLGLAASTVAADPTAPQPKPLALADFVDKTLEEGVQSRIPSPIAELIGVTPEIATLNMRITPDQTTDSMSHSFRAIAERDPATGEAKPVALILVADRKMPGKVERRWYRASLSGKLEKAVFSMGELDAQGNSVKGSGSPEDKDINSRKVKRDFQHELDLWLKRAHLRKEWRAGEFSDGVLKK